MPALGYAYDPRNYDPNTRPDPFPAGQYRFMVIKTEVKRTQAGDGVLLVIEHEVQGGPHNGRKFFNQINIDNPSVKAKEIGQSELSALCHSVGYLQPLTDSDALHGRTGEADIIVKPAERDRKTNKDYPAKNAVRRYILPDDGVKQAVNGATATQASAPTTAPASTTKKKPWEK